MKGERLSWEALRKGQKRRLKGKKEGGEKIKQRKERGRGASKQLWENESESMAMKGRRKRKKKASLGQRFGGINGLHLS